MMVSEPCLVGGRNGSGFGILPYVWSSHSGIRRKERNGDRQNLERKGKGDEIRGRPVLLSIPKMGTS